MFRSLSQHLVAISARCNFSSKLISTRFVFALAAISFLTLGAIASAQDAPFTILAYQDSLGVHVSFSHCQAAPTDKNCVLNFALYRSPDPGFNQSPIQSCAASANNSVDLCTDVSAKTGHTYTYKLCAGSVAQSDQSNCITSNSVSVPLGAPPPQKPAVTLTAASSFVRKGVSTTLNWNSVNATGLDLEPGKGKVGPSGSTEVAPTQTTTYTLTATGGGYTVPVSVTITVPCFTQWAPPTNLSAVTASEVHLKWTNPATDPNGTCPSPSTQVLIYRWGTNGPQQIAALEKVGYSGILPSQYTDSSALQPHFSYEYAVCEGGPADWQNSATNCAQPPGPSKSIYTWGADPVLSATRDGANSVRLQLALDQYTVTSVVVTRQGSDDPCRQGTTLSNGNQICKTVGANGGSPAQTTTVYSWTDSSTSHNPPGFQNSQSAPFVINLPDDTTVKPGVEYYYLAQVTWLSTMSQESNTVTVPNAYTSATLQHGIGTGTVLKPMGSAPPPPPAQPTAPPAMMRSASSMAAPAPPTQIAVAPPTMMRPAPVAAAPPPTSISAPTPVAPAATPMLLASGGTASAPLLAQPGTALSPISAQTAPISGNLAAAIKQVQQKPHDPQTLYALGKAYCAVNGKNTGVSYMYMAFLLAQQNNNAPLAAQIKSSLAQQGVNTQ